MALLGSRGVPPEAVNRAKAKVQQRPAETTGLVGAVVIIIAHAFNVTDPDVLVAMAVVIGALPAIVTFVVGVLERRKDQP